MEPLRLGYAGPEVADVQHRLGELGLACGSDPGVFDEVTRAAVRTFQQQRGLVADGVVGEDTWQALVSASFRLGDRLLYRTRPLLRGDDVRDLQRRLNTLGFDAGYDDGLYGPQTAAAVADFQLNVGIRQDGLAGPTTVHLLRRLHRQHQAAPAYAVREREMLRHPTRSSLAGARILLDPGHSPADPGLTNPDGIAEHELTWQLTSRLEGQLAARGAYVVLSRGPGTSPSPSARAQHANDEDVEVILSLHLNGHDTPLARGAAGYHFGTEVWVSDRGRQLAELAVDAIVATAGTADCRVHPSTSALVRESRAPAAVVEVGFATHPVEGRQLADPDHQHRLAGALADALTRFLVGGAPAPVGVAVPAGHDAG